MYKKAKIEITNRSGHEYSIDTNGVVVNETTGNILKGRIKNGYHLVCINQKYHPVHRLVALAFIKKDTNRKYVNHKDGNKANNHVTNLEWCTHQENMTHAKNTGLWVKKIGVEHGKCKTNEQEVRKVCELLEKGKNWQYIKHLVYMTRNTYLNIRRRSTWKHISCDYKF
jgi:hypothetical protein